MKNGLLYFCLVVFGLYGNVNAEDLLTLRKPIQALHNSAIEARRSAGLPDYELDEESCRICQRWAEHMASVNKMYHGGGENIIARGNLSEDGAIRLWLNSPPHHSFVMGRYLKAGWGVARSASGQLFFAGRFTNGDEDSTEHIGQPQPERRFRLFRRNK
jgi:uncharacterized protein YkwD